MVIKFLDARYGFPKHDGIKVHNPDDKIIIDVFLEIDGKDYQARSHGEGTVDAAISATKNILSSIKDTGYLTDHIKDVLWIEDAYFSTKDPVTERVIVAKNYEWTNEQLFVGEGRHMDTIKAKIIAFIDALNQIPAPAK